MLLWRELVDRAGSAQRARTAVRDGEYRRLLRGAYVHCLADDGPELRAAVLSRLLPDGVALSGRAALWAVGVDVLRSDGLLDVTTPRGRHVVGRPGMRAHIAALPDSQLVDLPGGLLAVSAARAFSDVARREPLVEAVALGDAVLRSGAATQEQLVRAVEGAAGLRHVVRARTVLGHLEPRAESQGESRLRMRLVLGGLPRPQAQVDLYDERRRHLARADLVLGGLVLEYDGREPHERDDVFVRDRRRQNALLDRHADVRRYTADDVRPGRAAALCTEVRRALTAASRLSPLLHRGPDTLRPARLEPLPTRADRSRAA